MHSLTAAIRQAFDPPITVTALIALGCPSKTLN